MMRQSPEIYHAEKKGVLLVRLWKRYLLVDVNEEEVYDIDPEKVTVHGDTVEWSLANLPEKPIETPDWKERNVGTVVRVRFRLGKDGHFWNCSCRLAQPGVPSISQGSARRLNPRASLWVACRQWSWAEAVRDFWVRIRFRRGADRRGKHQNHQKRAESAGFFPNVDLVAFVEAIVIVVINGQPFIASAFTPGINKQTAGAANMPSSDNARQQWWDGRRCSWANQPAIEKSPDGQNERNGN